MSDLRKRADFQSIINRMNLIIRDHGYIYADRKWNFHNICSPFSRLYLITAGKGMISNKIHTVELLPGFAYIVPVNSTYDFYCTETMEKYFIHFNITSPYSNDLLLGIKSCVSYKFEQRDISAMLSAYWSNNTKDLLKCKATLLSIICDIVLPYLPDSYIDYQLYSKYKKIYEMISEKCRADLKIQDLAHIIGISANTLSKSFKEDTGDTLKNYITKSLLTRCMEHLLASDENIKEIAYTLGFTDEFYFSRFFKKHTGLSPSSYKLKNMME